LYVEGFQEHKNKLLHLSGTDVSSSVNNAVSRNVVFSTQQLSRFHCQI